MKQLGLFQTKKPAHFFDSPAVYFCWQVRYRELQQTRRPRQRLCVFLTCVSDCPLLGEASRPQQTLTLIIEWHTRLVCFQLL